MSEIDRGRVEWIAAAAMRAVVANYRRGPASRDRIWEALNAIAMIAVTVISAIEDDAAVAQAREFFDRAVNANLHDSPWRH